MDGASTTVAADSWLLWQLTAQQRRSSNSRSRAPSWVNIALSSCFKVACSQPPPIVRGYVRLCEASWWSGLPSCVVHNRTSTLGVFIPPQLGARAGPRWHAPRRFDPTAADCGARWRRGAAYNNCTRILVGIPRYTYTYSYCVLMGELRGPAWNA